MSLDAFRRAQEDKFFKVEQERDILNYVKRLQSEGRLADVMEREAPKLHGAQGGVLPQVLAQQLRLAPPVKEVANVRKLDRSFMTTQVLKGATTGNPMFIGSATLGSRVSLGKGKWNAGVNTVEGASIFSVTQAPKLIEGVEIQERVPQRVAREMVDNRFVEFRGMRLKLMPDPTPGRAMAWGGTLAVWGSAITVVGTCRLLGISTMEDMRRVMKEKLTPLATGIRDAFEPLTSRVKHAEQAHANYSNSAFATSIKSKLS